MRVGTAWADITPDRPLPLLGQMHRRIPRHTHDPLTANAVAFDDGSARAVLVSCDLCFMPHELARRVQAACAERLDVDGRAVLLAATHTHLGPATAPFASDAPDEAYLARLEAVLVEVVGRAVEDLAEAELLAGAGWLDEMGFNRRGLHADGRADMYHGSWNADFAGVEGPRDGEVGVLFARTADGAVKAVVSSFSTHPNSVEGECFFGADVPGSVRRVLRGALGEDVGVVYLTGAAGNTAPSIMVDNPRNVQPWRGEQGWRRSGWYLGGEILKVLAAAHQPMDRPPLRLAAGELAIPMRPWPEDFQPARKWSEGPWRDYYLANQADWPRLLREESPMPVRLNVLRIGEAAICTNPAELYVEHGLAIKAGSPARVTLVSELTDGYVGYVPTREAFGRGGYSTWPARSSRLVEDAGDRIVAETKRLLAEAFAEP